MMATALLLGELLARRAAITPARPALVALDTGHTLSYAALHARVNRLANALRGRYRVGPGDRVAVLAHNHIAHVELMFAAATLGAVFVPLNWRLSAVELAALIDDCEPCVVAVGPQFAAVASALPVPALVALERADMRGVEYEELVAEGANVAPAPGPRALSSEAPACILYTSGTTGRPKGALISHRQIAWNCINTAVSWGLSERDVSPVFAPLFHAGGLFAFLTPLLYVGGKVILAPGVHGDADLYAIEREGCTHVLGVPTMYRMWRACDAYARADFHRVRFITGGAPCPAGLMQAWRDEKGVVFRQGYGLTEVGPNCFTMTDEESVSKTGSVGRPALLTEARLVSDGVDVRDGEVGELVLGGPLVCAGYWRNAEATAEAIRDGWFHTGDLARRDADGFYTIAGRAKEMFITGGENVYAAEVEAVFHAHPRVAEAALVARPDERWGEVGVMVVIARGQQAVTEDELIGFCAERLARYKIPQRVVFAEEFPRTALGKPQKAELSKLYVGRV